MSEDSKKKLGQGKALENVIIGFGKVIFFVGQISWHGFNRAIFKNVDRLLAIFIFCGVVFILVYWNWKHLLILNWLFPRVFSESVVRFFVLHVAQFIQFLVFAGFPVVFLGVVLGIGHFAKMRRYQNELKHIGLKSALGTEPKVIDVEEPEAFKKKIILASQGVGLEHYQNKKSDLESTFGAIVESIRISEKSRKLVEIHLVDKELSTMVPYQTCISMLKEPASFIVGESLGGLLTQQIRLLPHLLVAGTSGNGKSVFFNQVLISLNRSTPNIQFYLLDLKLGVEVKAYRNLPNVSIAKNATEAVNLLQAVVQEMYARFELLEKSGHKIIEPERDKKDLIIVGVDEASVLYMRKSGNSVGNKLTNIARNLTDEITKLGRAAGIHLIAATQKVTDKNIGTEVQENIGGRVVFRVGTLQGSSTVLGRKSAQELPDIKGRAIWTKGNELIEVQTPFMSENVIEQEIKNIKSEFDSGKRICLQPMLTGKAGDKRADDSVHLLNQKVA